MLVEEFVSKHSHKFYHKKLFIVTAGGGSTIISSLFQQGSISAFFDSYKFLYSHDSLADFIRCFPKKNVSPEVATLLTTSINVPPNTTPIGITCSLFTPNQREGRVNQVFISYNGQVYNKVFDSKCRIMQDKEIEYLVFDILAENTSY